MKTFVSGKQMHKIDSLAISRFHIASIQLMEQAGQAIFQCLRQEINKDDEVVVVCGVGNNGGDGLVVARLLFLEGFRVSYYIVGSQNEMSDDCYHNYQRCVDLKMRQTSDISSCTIVIDAIFGTGLSRDLEETMIQLIESINAQKKKVYSIDIPSGIDADNGICKGAFIEADKTYILQAPKLGLYFNDGKIASGERVILDIGIPQSLLKQYADTIYLIDAAEMREWLPKRSIVSNKGSYGHVLCVGGSLGMSGSITMASLAALRSGCGLLTIAVPASIQDRVAKCVLEGMTIPLLEAKGFISSEAKNTLATIIDSKTCILFGCGLGREKSLKPVMEMLLKSNKPLIVDADGLGLLKPLLHQYVNRKHLIITPHLKEFSRLIDVDVQNIIKHPLDYAKMFCKQYPYITLVLKSDTTIIAQNETIYINPYGNNGLAKGGSGDVLAGIITGLYAQCKNTLQASVLGVFLHAYTADQLLAIHTVYGLLPTDIIKHLDQTIKRLEEAQ